MSIGVEVGDEVKVQVEEAHPRDDILSLKEVSVAEWPFDVKVCGKNTDAKVVENGESMIWGEAISFKMLTHQFCWMTALLSMLAGTFSWAPDGSTWNCRRSLEELQLFVFHYFRSLGAKHVQAQLGATSSFIMRHHNAKQMKSWTLLSFPLDVSNPQGLRRSLI